MPGLELKNVIEKASVEFYQPVTERERQIEDHSQNQNASFYGQRQQSN